MKQNNKTTKKQNNNYTKSLYFNAPPSSNGVYTKMLEQVTQSEPVSSEQQQDVIVLLDKLINDSEIPFSEKMIYFTSFIHSIQEHSYGIAKSISQNE